MPKKMPKKSRRKTGNTRNTRAGAALERAKKTVTQEVLAKAMAELPGGTTMGELIASFRSAGFAKDLAAMTLRDFVTSVGNGAPTSRARKKTAKRRARKTANTRTAKGRADIDAAVSAFLSSRSPARSEEIRKAVGGTAAQVRQSLSRLIAAKKATKSGQKRATQYSWSAGRGGRATKARPKPVRTTKAATRGQ